MPLLREDGIVVRSQISLISAGTERMMLKLANKSLLGKAKERPDLVKKVLAKLKRDGFLATFNTVREQLDREVPVGYSSSGIVTEVGARARKFSLGQQVACAGAGYANHSEFNYIPRLLAATVPKGVSPEAAAYTTVGTIAMQGIRNAEARVGETVVVIGLGLLGQLSVQILKGAGCRVIGLDLSQERIKLAKEHGAELAISPADDTAEKQILKYTRKLGADAVVITAATASNEPVELAARIARDRATVVMVGVTGMDIPRRTYFEKELTFIVSRSYGPGRYDIQYEEHGHDYPAGHVRWTENRNMESFLDLVASGSVKPEVCTTHRFAIAEAEAAYELILSNSEPHLGVVITYPERPESSEPEPARISLRAARRAKPVDQVGVSFIGAGGFARGVHLPNLSSLDNVRLRGLVDASGIAASSAGKKYGFDYCTSEEKEILEDNETDLVFITTPHSQHAAGVCRTLQAGKSAFVEKPLSITREGLVQIRESLTAGQGRVMVGFNRRFAPLAEKLKDFVSNRGPMCIHYRCNAGPLPEGHWISDPSEGGRILGEACHFFDFFAHLTSASPVEVFAAAPSGATADDAVVTITYADGSVCNLAYTSAGPASFSKEYVEVFAGGCAATLEDFRHLQLHDQSGHTKKYKKMRADKGHRNEVVECVAAIRAGEDMPISAESLFETTLVSMATLESIQNGKPVTIANMLS